MDVAALAFARDLAAVPKRKRPTDGDNSKPILDLRTQMRRKSFLGATVEAILAFAVVRNAI
jgi:hypothetical protein